MKPIGRSVRKKNVPFNWSTIRMRIFGDCAFMLSVPLGRLNLHQGLVSVLNEISELKLDLETGNPKRNPV